MEIQRTRGLRETPKDSRDFKLGASFRLPDLEDLPKNFVFEQISVKDQKSTDFCSAFMTTYMSEIQEDIELSPEWSFAVSKMISGDVDGWGQNLRDAMKVHTQYGALPKDVAPFSLENKTDEFLRNIQSWPKQLFEKAKAHKKKSYFKVEGRYDAFDDIRASIWLFREKKQSVGLGVMWGWGNDPIIPKEDFDGFGHAVACIGWKDINGEPYLVIHNSYGKTAGDNGGFYFPREIINKNVARFGAYMFVDMDPKDAKMEQWSIIRQIYEGIRTRFNALFEYLAKAIQPTYYPWVKINL